MKDAVAVRVLQRVGDRGAERFDLPKRQRTLSQPGLERAARHKFHDEKLLISVGVEVEDRRDPGMRQPGERQGLTPESLVAGVVAERPECPAQQHLDGDDAIEPGVVGLPHFAHPAGADPFEQPIATQRVSVHGRRDDERMESP